MAKMNYQSTPKSIDQDLKDHFLKEAETRVESNGLPVIFRLKIWINVLIQIAIIAVIYAVLTLVAPSSISLIVFVVLLILASLYWFIFAVLTKSVKKRAIGNFYDVQQEIYKKHFDKYFDNVIPQGRVTQNPAMARIAKNRPTSIPSDATMIKIKPTYSFKVEGATVTMNHFNWYWTRSDGKRTTRYYVPSIAMGVFDMKSNKFDGLNLRLLKNTFIRKNKLHLENAKFDKAWVHYTNDEVKQRMLLSPLAQERLSEDNFFTSSRGKFSFDMQNGEVAICKTENQIPFDLQLSRKSKVNYGASGIEFKRSIGKSLLKDLDNDILMVQLYLSKLFAFKNLLR